MLFTNVMKTLVLIALFVAIPILIYRLCEAALKQCLSYARARINHSEHKG